VRREEQPTRLAAVHQLLRPRDGAHFRLVALCTAGRERGSFRMQLQVPREQLRWQVDVIRRHAPDLALNATITDLKGDRRAALAESVLWLLRSQWPEVHFCFDDHREARRNYYTDVCFAVHAVMPDGSRPNLSDGGFTDWTAQLLADSKERMLISGLGSERLLGLSAAPT
jgi:hypothetical protein